MIIKQVLLLIGLIFTLWVSSIAQSNEKFPFDEFQVALNMTNEAEIRYGFGLGTYIPFMQERRVNLIFGLEFNRTSLFLNSMYQGHWAHATDITYYSNCISIPMGLRVNFGKKTVVFIEPGFFGDFIISAKREGTMHTYLPDSSNHVTYTVSEFDEKVKFSNTFGLYIGAGVLIPVSNIKLIIKPEYKFGINPLQSSGMDEIPNRYFRISIGVKI